MTTNENRFNGVHKGLFFEEFALGQEYISSGRTVTEADVVNFASLSGDWNPIHTDKEYAAQHPFGQRVAHGMLGVAIASGLAMRLGFLEDTALAFREIREWKFSQPIHLGDTIHLRATVKEIRPVKRLNGGMVTFQIEVFNQQGTIVQHGDWVMLVKSQEI